MCVAAGLTAAQMFAASLAVSAASTALSFVGQQQQANAQVAYQTQLANQQNQYMLDNAEAANDAYIEQAAAQNTQLNQAQKAASQEIQTVQKDRLQAQGTAAATSEAAGLSFNMLMRDYLREEAGYKDSVRQQLEWDANAASRQIESFQSTANSRINSVQPYTPSPVSTPSLLSAGVQFAGSAFDAYNKYTSYDSTTGKRVFA